MTKPKLKRGEAEALRDFIEILGDVTDDQGLEIDISCLPATPCECRMCSMLASGETQRIISQEELDAIRAAHPERVN